MIRIVNDLLDLSRLEAQRGKDFLRERGDLGEFLRLSLADHAPPRADNPLGERGAYFRGLTARLRWA